MYVDPRVAHACARVELERRTVTPVELTEKINRILDDHSRRCVFGKSGREVRRDIEQKVLPAVRKAGLDCAQFDHNGRSGIYMQTVVGCAEKGMRGVQFEYVPNSTGRKTLTGGEIFVIKPHAVARCMQRNGVLRLNAIDLELKSAIWMAKVLCEYSCAEGWQQIALPTPLGLFVGVIDPASCIPVLATYFKPGENGRSTRWERYREFFAPLVAAGQATTEADLKKYVSNTKELLSEQGPLSERFPWLLQSYECCADPEDHRWEVGRLALAA
jgi:hypothetical protein